MARFVRTPTQSEAFYRVPDELHLRRDVTGRQTGMLRPIPDHDAAVGAHGGYDVRILWLVAGLVDLALVIDLLYNVEFHLHGRRFLARSFSVTTNLFAFFIVVGGVRGHRLWELYVSNLEVILGFVRSMCANKQPMRAVVFVGDTTEISTSYILSRPWAHACLSGNHCVVKVGHSSALLSIISYKKGAFFFHVLYSSLMIFSAIFSSS